MTSSSLLPQGAIALDTKAARLVAGYETTPHGKIGHLRFNFPDKHNVIDLEGWQGIAYVMHQLAALDDIRLIILRGVGGKTFVAGADISQFEEVLAGPEGTEFDIATVAAFDAIAQCPIPTLAAIEGYCLGGGLGLAAACDLRLAREDARFGIPAGKLGLAYPANATQHLSTLVGPAHAKRIIFTADRLPIDEAERIGLVQHRASAENFETALQNLAESICAKAPMSLRASKFILDNPHAEAAQVKKRLADCLASEDYAEGRQAFLQKRDPIFKGK
ncbi:MAG: enoyl-CoA hydratase [Rhodobiaceae bacterium]|jgi:enoyl-CoA hydratase|nr:enoyl-CoA hydratase [Rhodobiaceae bacterium]MBT5517646.1 enoyl-CoA hydratase [Rhodobiaceae bacterium]